jgi:SPP1 gp7 family putative phage head morphogenesis protein
MMAPTGKAVVLTPVFANVGVQVWYQSRLDQLITEMFHSARVELIPAVQATPAVIATDAAPPPTAAGIVFRCGERILLLQRANNSGWGLPGGKVERGETSQEAARRETWEETGLRFGGPLVLLTIHRFKSVIFATYGADVDDMFVPTLEREHKAYRWATLAEALLLDLHPGVRLTLTHTSDSPEFASDASPTKELQRALQRWGDDWVKRFDKMAQGIADDFATRNKRATEAAMQASLKKAGFTVPFKPSKSSLEAYKAVAAENVGLIKSIAQKYHTDVQTQVWESVKRGGDLKTVSEKLEKSYGVTRRRAALIARDQNAKAKATIEAVRHQELGIKQGIWMHSKAGKEPRPTHVAMNGKLYDLSKGMWDSDEKEYVHPGQLINCRCTMRPYIPGFETTAYPQWDVVQT